MRLPIAAPPSVRERRSSAASIRGGSSERETTAFAVAPDGPSGPGAVITVTAVGTSAHRAAELGGIGDRRHG